MKVYLLHHWELLESGNSRKQDEIVHHVSSSVEEAVKYMKKTHCQPWAWWELMEWTVDSDEQEKFVGYYGPRGGAYKTNKFEKAVEKAHKAFESHLAKV